MDWDAAAERARDLIEAQQAQADEEDIKRQEDRSANKVWTDTGLKMHWLLQKGLGTNGLDSSVEPPVYSLTWNQAATTYHLSYPVSSTPHQWELETVDDYGDTIVITQQNASSNHDQHTQAFAIGLQTIAVMNGKRIH